MRRSRPINTAEALARRNAVLVQLLLMDKEFMRQVQLGLEESIRGETISLADLRLKYGISR